MRNVLFLGLLVFTATPSLKAIEESRTESAPSLTDRIINELPALRLSENDLKLSAGWPMPLSLAVVENLFSAPHKTPSVGKDYLDQLEAAKTPFDYFAAGAVILRSGSRSPVVINTHPLAVRSNLLSQKSPALKTLIAAIKDAQVLLNEAIDSVSPEARAQFLKQNDWPDAATGVLSQEISSRVIKKSYDDMAHFDQVKILKAGQLIFSAIDATQKNLSAGINPKKSLRFETSIGTVLVGSREDDVYTEKELDGVTLLIDLGGNNTYLAPVATAHEKEIRVVIDLGANVTIKGDKDYQGNAGTGVFGIGVLLLPNADGLKTITTGSFSQGTGIGGIGALIANGPVMLSANRYTQGTGVVGLGLLVTKSTGASTIEAVRSGQGAGFVQGVGVFVHEGNSSTIQGGLVEPDPREPDGSVSMCQGVGFGHRAYSGGGVGLALVKGSSNTVLGSYFSQGVGYWHSFGGFRVRGDGNHTQARRYDLGSGVHSAFGYFDLYGNKNRVLNWGVGPAYGWDRATGSALIVGDENEIQVDWGSQTASIGSYSFSSIQGNANKLKLCAVGSANINFNEMSYSLHWIEGVGNRIQCFEDEEIKNMDQIRYRSPWGLISLKGVHSEKDLKLTPPVWPTITRKETIERATVDLQNKIKEADGKNDTERLADLADVSAAFSLDKKSPRQAMAQLLSLDNNQLHALVDILEPKAVDQLIQLSVVFPAYGKPMAAAIFEKIPGADRQKKSTLIHLLRSMPPSAVLSSLFSLFRETTDERLKSMILRTLATVLNQDTGEEPGTRAVLKTLSNNHKRTKTLALKLRSSEAFGVLAMATEADTKTRVQFLTALPEDITSPIQEKGSKELVRLVKSNWRANKKRINNELKQLEEAEPKARAMAAELLTSTTSAVRTGAVVALGQLAHPSDIPLLAPLLEDESASVRECAAVALGRMGEPALKTLTHVLATGSTRSKQLVLVAVTQSVSDKLAPLLLSAFTSPDAEVRLMSLTALNWLPEALRPKKAYLVKHALKQKPTETDPAVKLAFEFLK